MQQAGRPAAAAQQHGGRGAGGHSRSGGGGPNPPVGPLHLLLAGPCASCCDAEAERCIVAHGVGHGRCRRLRHRAAAAGGGFGGAAAAARACGHTGARAPSAAGLAGAGACGRAGGGHASRAQGRMHGALPGVRLPSAAPERARAAGALWQPLEAGRCAGRPWGAVPPAYRTGPPQSCPTCCCRCWCCPCEARPGAGCGGRLRPNRRTAPVGRSCWPAARCACWPRTPPSTAGCLGRSAAPAAAACPPRVWRPAALQGHTGEGWGVSGAAAAAVTEAGGARNAFAAALRLAETAGAVAGGPAAAKRAWLPATPTAEHGLQRRPPLAQLHVADVADGGVLRVMPVHLHPTGTDSQAGCWPHAAREEPSLPRAAVWSRPQGWAAARCRLPAGQGLLRRRPTLPPLVAPPPHRPGLAFSGASFPLQAPPPPHAACLTMSMNWCMTVWYCDRPDTTTFLPGVYSSSSYLGAASRGGGAGLWVLGCGCGWPHTGWAQARPCAPAWCMPAAASCSRPCRRPRSQLHRLLRCLLHGSSPTPAPACLTS